MKYLAAHECAVRGTADFPIERYHVTKSHPRYEMPFHWHMEIEVMRVLTGEFRVIIDGECFTLHSGDSFVVYPGSIHGGTPKDCVYECIVIDADRFLGSSTALREKYSMLLTHGKQVSPVFPPESPAGVLVSSLCDVLEKESAYYEFAAIGLLWQLFGVIGSQEAERKVSASQQNLSNVTTRMKAVLDYIRTNFTAKLTLRELATVAQMSPEHFCRVFHSVTGQSPITCLNYYRIECAAELLCFTDDSITEIAYRCGFSDLSYFYRLFHRYKGIAPKSYRKTHQKSVS